MVKKIEVNIPNKVLYSIIALVAILVLGVGVYAYGGIAPATMGHTMGELMPSCTGLLSGTSGVANSWACKPVPPTCSGTNQVLHWSGSAWSCVTVDVGYGCNWVGWGPSIPSSCSIESILCPSSGDCEEPNGGPTVVCSQIDYGLEEAIVQQEECVSGTVRDIRYILLCAYPSDGCPYMA